MIWIIGGTSEAREMLFRIRDLNNFIFTIATEDGREFLDTERLEVGRMDLKDMMKFVEINNIKLIVDLTHPYADIVSNNAKKVAKAKSLKYARYVRNTLENIDDIIYLNSYEKSYEYLEKIKGTVFFTTGSKHIEQFEKVKGENRFIYRIIPAISSLEKARNLGVEMKDIVANLGPFSKEYNKAMFKEYNIDYCVTKDSGKTGGVIEKLEACKELEIDLIVIGREKEKGYNNLDEIENLIRNMN